MHQRTLGIVLGCTLFAAGTWSWFAPANAGVASDAPDAFAWDAPKPEDSTAISAWKIGRAAHRCAQILRQRPLPGESDLVAQLTPALRDVDAAIKHRGTLKSPGTGIAWAYSLEMMAELNHLGADVKRIKAADESRGQRLEDLIAREAPTLSKVAGFRSLGEMVRESSSQRDNSATSILQTLRSQIELYKLQHKDGAPDLASGWKQLTARTDADGNVTDKGPFGPYLQREPVNPLTEGRKLQVVEVGGFRKVPVEGHQGFDFVFDKKGDHFYMVDANGKIWDR